MCSTCASQYWKQQWDQIPFTCIEPSIQRVCRNCKGFCGDQCLGCSTHLRASFREKKRKLVKRFCQNENCGKVMELCRDSQRTPQLMLFILLSQTFNKNKRDKLMGFFKGLTTIAQVRRIIQQSKAFDKDDAAHLIDIMIAVKSVQFKEPVCYEPGTKRVCCDAEQEPVSYENDHCDGESVYGDGAVEYGPCLRRDGSFDDRSRFSADDLVTDSQKYPGIYDPEADLQVDPMLPQDPMFFNPKGYAPYYNALGIRTNYKPQDNVLNRTNQAGEILGEAYKGDSDPFGFMAPNPYQRAQGHHTSQICKCPPKIPLTNPNQKLVPTDDDKHGNALNDWITNYVIRHLYKNSHLKIGKKYKPFSAKWLKDFHISFDTGNISSRFERATNGGQGPLSKEFARDLYKLYNEVGGPGEEDYDMNSDRDLDEGTDKVNGINNINRFGDDINPFEKLLYYVYRYTKRGSSKPQPSQRSRKSLSKLRHEDGITSKPGDIFGKNGAPSSQHQFNRMSGRRVTHGVTPVSFYAPQEIPRRLTSKERETRLSDAKRVKLQLSDKKPSKSKHSRQYNRQPLHNISVVESSRKIRQMQEQYLDNDKRVDLYRDRDSRASYGYPKKPKEMPIKLPELEIDFPTRKVNVPSHHIDTFKPIDFNTYVSDVKRHNRQTPVFNPTIRNFYGRGSNRAPSVR